MIRKIVSINEEKCNGCEQCIPNCAEGAIKIINGKAKLIDDSFCDGLGACLGHCPQDAIEIIEREAPVFDEEAVKEHLNYMPGEDNVKDIQCECPASVVMDLRTDNRVKGEITERKDSELRQWPVQLKLVSPDAPYFKDAELLVAADCVPFSYANFHSDLLRGKSLIIGCPKLDDTVFYTKKLTEILKKNNIKSITLVNMEVPCCFGLQKIVENSIKASGKTLPIRQWIISVKGDKMK